MIPNPDSWCCAWANPRALTYYQPALSHINMESCTQVFSFVDSIKRTNPNWKSIFGNFFKLAQVEVPTQLLLELLELEESGLEEKLAEELTRSSLEPFNNIQLCFFDCKWQLEMAHEIWLREMAALSWAFKVMVLCKIAIVGDNRDRKFCRFAGWRIFSTKSHHNWVMDRRIQASLCEGPVVPMSTASPAWLPAACFSKISIILHDVKWPGSCFSQWRHAGPALGA